MDVKFSRAIGSACSLLSVTVEQGEDAFPSGARGLEETAAALDWLRGIQRVLRGGGDVLVLTKAELRELRLAAGNSVADDDWYRQRNPRERRALLDAAEKAGFGPVMLPAGSRAK